MSRPGRGRRVIIALGAALGLGAAAPPDATEAPIILPKVSVAAQVPLRKIAEYQMREKRFAAAAVTDGRYIYIIGGQDDKLNLLDTIERFDTRTNTSEEFARLHTARLWHRAVLREGKIYVLGGSAALLGSPAAAAPPFRSADQSRGSLERRGEARIAGAEAMLMNDDSADTAALQQHLGSVASMEAVDLATRKVTSLPEMPDARTEFGCVVLGGEIYVLGGKHLHARRLSRTNTVKIYSFATGKWRAGLPMPKPVETQATIVDGPFIIAAGGYDGRLASDAVEAFDPRNQQWIQLPALCQASSAHSVAFLGHFLFLFGNYDSPEELIAYDLVTKTSRSYTLQYTPARHTAAVVVAGKIYVIGGKMRKDTAALDCIQVFAPIPAKP